MERCCRNCGAPLNEGAVFCKGCGTKITARAAAQPGAAPGAAHTAPPPSPPPSPPPPPPPPPSGPNAFKDFSQGVNTDRPAKRSKIQGWLITLLVLAILVFAGYIGLYLLDRDVLKPFDARSSSVEPVTEQVSEDKEEQ